MKLALTFHTDPGHGWLEVPAGLLLGLGVFNHISSCSYMNKDKVAFLEEDLDAGTFIKAAKADGWEISFKEEYKEYTPIRNMPSFPAHKNWEFLSGYKPWPNDDKGGEIELN